MLQRYLWSFIFVAALLSLNQCYVTAGEVNFKLGGKEGNATAIVKEQSLDLDVKLGNKEDYLKPKNFNLKIADCSVDITVESISTGFLCRFTGPNNAKSAFVGLKSFVATPKAIAFTGEETPIQVNCGVTFGNKTNGKYYIPVALSGNVPKNLCLLSTSANMDDTAASNDRKTNWAMIGGIIGGSVLGFLLLLGSLFAGFFVYRRRKNKILEQNNTNFSTAKSTEVTLSKTPETKASEPISTQAAPKLDDNKAKEKQKSESKKAPEPISKQATPKLDDSKAKQKSDDKKAPEPKSKQADPKLDDNKAKRKSDDKKASEPKSKKEKQKADSKREASSERRSKKKSGEEKAKKRKSSGKNKKEKSGSERQSDRKTSDRKKSDQKKPDINLNPPDYFKKPEPPKSRWPEPAFIPLSWFLEP